MCRLSECPGRGLAFCPDKDPHLDDTALGAGVRECPRFLKSQKGRKEMAMVKRRLVVLAMAMALAGMGAVAADDAEAASHRLGWIEDPYKAVAYPCYTAWDGSVGYCYYKAP